MIYKTKKGFVTKLCEKNSKEKCYEVKTKKKYNRQEYKKSVLATASLYMA